MVFVGDIMHSTISIDISKTINDAAKKMTKYNRGSVVITEKTEPVGIFTERDILRLVGNGEKVFNQKVKKYYQKRLVKADEKTSLVDGGRIMAKNKVRRLLITRGEKIVGIVTSNTISRNMQYSIAEKLLNNNLTSKASMPIIDRTR